MFESSESLIDNAVIKVIGIGGSGGNAAEHMPTQNIEGVELIGVNTDSEALTNSSARSTIQSRRMQLAEYGINELSQSVDSFITIPNAKLLSVFGKNISLLDAPKAANGVLQGAVPGIAGLIDYTAWFD